MRRSPDEIRRLVLHAANELFTEQGYHGTKTRQIAERADVAESVVFRHFSSKADLFEATIIAPFMSFVNAWARAWDRNPTKSTDQMTIARSFVRGFYEVAEQHRGLLLTLLAAQVQGGETELARVAETFSEHFADGLFVMRRVLLKQGSARDYQHFDPPVTVAVASGAILSVVLMDTWLFPANERRPSRARQIDELTHMLVFGISARPPHVTATLKGHLV